MSKLHHKGLEILVKGAGVHGYFGDQLPRRRKTMSNPKPGDKVEVNGKPYEVQSNGDLKPAPSSSGGFISALVEAPANFVAAITPGNPKST